MEWGDATRTLAAAIDALDTVDVAGLSVEDKHGYLKEVERQLRRLDCRRHQATHVLESSGELLDLGYRTLAQWHRDVLHCSTHRAGRIGALSRELVHMPTVTKRWLDGDLDADAARAISLLRNPRTEDTFAEWEPWLADQPVDHDHRRLRTVLASWLIHADPDGPDPDSPEPDVKVTTTLGGTVQADVWLDPIAGAAFKDLFQEIVEALFAADWADAKERLGREPTVSDLTRTAKQRRHDAFVQIITQARAALAHGLAELWDGTPLSPAELADVLETDPDIQRFVYGTDEQPIAYNPKARLYTGKLSHALLTRDRHCTGRGCDADTRHGAIDHIQPAAHGGQTTPTNGRATCHPCNRSRPRRRFTTDPDPP